MAAEALKLINSICKNKDIYLALTEDPEVFGEWGDVWTEVKKYYTTHRSVPSADLLQQINSDFEPMDVDGDTSFYLSEMKREYVGSKLRNVILKTGQHLQSGHSPLAVTDALQQELARLQRYSATAQDLDIVDLEKAKEYLDRVKKAADDNGGSVGIPTGFRGIDAYYETGMAPGHVIYAIGFSSHGKTWFAGKMTERAWDYGVKPLIISLEMTPEDMRNRILTQIGQGEFKNSDLQRGIYDPEAFVRLGKRRAEKTGFIVTSGMGGQEVTPNFVDSKIDQHNPGLVVLDYQQLAMDNAKSSDMVARMANFSREIKLVATNRKIPILIISAVTDKDKDQGRNRPPDMGQLAWGRSLEYTADLVLAIHKVPDTDLTEVVMRKNRFGELGDMFLKTDYNSGIYEEVYDDKPTD